MEVAHERSYAFYLPDSLLQQMFVVRFLGSMAVQSDNTSEVIYEAMRQVLAARAIHNIFRMTESHLMVTSKNLRYCKIVITYSMSVCCFIHETWDEDFLPLQEMHLQGRETLRLTSLKRISS